MNKIGMNFKTEWNFWKIQKRIPHNMDQQSIPPISFKLVKNHEKGDCLGFQGRRNQGDWRESKLWNDMFVIKEG